MVCQSHAITVIRTRESYFKTLARKNLSLTRTFIKCRSREGKSEWTMLYVDDGALFGEHSAVRKATSEIKMVFAISRAATYMNDETRTKLVRFLGIRLFAEDGRNSA